MPKPNHEPKFSTLISAVTTGLALFSSRSIATRVLTQETNSDALALREVSQQALAISAGLQKRAHSLANPGPMISSSDTIVAQVSKPVTSTSGIAVYEIKQANNTHVLKGQYYQLNDGTPSGAAFLIAATTTDLAMNPSLTSDGSNAFVVYQKEKGAGNTPDKPGPNLAKIINASSVTPNIYIGVDAQNAYTNLDITKFNNDGLFAVYQDSVKGLVSTVFTSSLTRDTDLAIPSYPDCMNYQNGRLATFSDGSIIVVYETKGTPRYSFANVISTNKTVSAQISLDSNNLKLPKVAVTSGDVAAILTLDNIDNIGKNLYLELKNKDGTSKRFMQRVNLLADTHYLSNHRIEVDPATGELAVMWDREVSTGQWISVFRFVDNTGNIQGNKEIEATKITNPGMPAVIPAGSHNWVQTRLASSTMIDVQRYTSANTAPQAGMMSNQEFLPNTPINISIPKSIFTDPDIDQTGLTYSVKLAGDAPLPSGFSVDSSSDNIVIQHAGMSDGIVNFKVIAMDILGATGSATFKLTVSPTAQTQVTTAKPIGPVTSTGSMQNSGGTPTGITNNSGVTVNTTSSPVNGGSGATSITSAINSNSPITSGNSVTATTDPLMQITDPATNPGMSLGVIVGIIAGAMVYVAGGATALWCWVRHRNNEAPAENNQPNSYLHNGGYMHGAVKPASIGNYDKVDPLPSADYDKVGTGLFKPANAAANNPKSNYDKVSQVSSPNYDHVEPGTGKRGGVYEECTSPLEGAAANAAKSAVPYEQLPRNAVAYEQMPVVINYSGINAAGQQVGAAADVAAPQFGK